MPDAVRTEAVAPLLDPATEAALAERSQLGRMLEPPDVAGVVAPGSIRPCVRSPAPY